MERAGGTGRLSPAARRAYASVVTARPRGAAADRTLRMYSVVFLVPLISDVTHPSRRPGWPALRLVRARLPLPPVAPLCTGGRHAVLAEFEPQLLHLASLARSVRSLALPSEADDLNSLSAAVAARHRTCVASLERSGSALRLLPLLPLPVLASRRRSPSHFLGLVHSRSPPVSRLLSHRTMSKPGVGMPDDGQRRVCAPLALAVCSSPRAALHWRYSRLSSSIVYRWLDRSAALYLVAPGRPLLPVTEVHVHRRAARWALLLRQVGLDGIRLRRWRRSVPGICRCGLQPQVRPVHYQASCTRRISPV